jgi:uncharacterized membrane protein
MRKILAIFIAFIMIIIMFSSYASNSTGIKNDNITYADKGSWDDVTYPGITDNEIRSYDKINRDPYVGGFGRYFTANYGQAGNDIVKYYIQGQGVWYTNSGIVIEVFEPIKTDNYNFNKFNLPIEKLFEQAQKDNSRKSAVLRIDFENCNNVIPYGEEELPHKSNFFYGNDSDKWCTNVPNYQSIIYKNIYDNIDLKYYFNEDGLKYDFIVYPEGDPNNIAINVEGAEDIKINSKDGIIIKTEFNNMFDKNLFVYQEEDRGIIEVPAEFKMDDSNCYGFKISDDYDKTTPLIIDPLIYSTYIGGTQIDISYDLKVDGKGNAYTTGWTYSSFFPVTDGANDTSYNGAEDIFVVKFDRNGSSLLYSTFIGGNSRDRGYAMDVDLNGCCYITGQTQSQDFPTTPGAYDETPNGGNNLFVFKLYPNGDFLYFSTFIGILWGDSFGTDIVIDDQGNTYVTGIASGNYPITPNVYQKPAWSSYNVVVSKINAAGTNLSCSTVISGDHPILHDYGLGIALDNENNICVTGHTMQTTFPTTSGAYRETFTHTGTEGFVFKLNSDMTKLLYSTFIGIITLPEGSLPILWFGYLDVLIDTKNNVIVVGSTDTNNYPTTKGAYDESFNGDKDLLIVKLNSTLSTLLYATYLGGKNYEMMYNSALDKDDNVLAVGFTNSSDFPVSEGAFDPSHNGLYDVFVVILNITESELRYSTYIGGSNNEYGAGIDTKEKGYIYIGGPAEPGFPTTSGSYSQTHKGGQYDCFVLKLKTRTPPLIRNMSVSENEVYRPHLIEVYSNAIDYGDLEKHLTPYFEYQEVDDPINWSTTKLTPPIFVNEQWQTTFTIPVNASLGFYDFRVRYNDTDNMWSRWMYLNGSLLVLNNPPKIDYFNLSKSNVITGEELSILVNGSDVEDDPQKLLFKSEYKYSTGDFWDPVKFHESGFTKTSFKFNFSMAADIEYGYYDFRVRSIDCDNGTSGWSYLNKSLMVNSAPPRMISIDVSKPEIYRTEKSEVYVNCTDFDSPRDELTVELEYMPVAEDKWHDLSPDDMGNFWIDDLRTTKTSYLGIYNFRARATDWEDNTCQWFYLNDSFQVLNNLPKLIDITNIPEKMDRKRSVTITVNGSDKEDNEYALYVELEYKLPGSQVWIVDYLSAPYYFESCWNHEFSLPFDAPSGKYSFRVRLQDLDKDWSTYLYLNDSLLVENQIPILISFDQLPKDIYRTETVIVTSAGSDLETSVTELECNIYYKSPDDVDWQKLEENYNDTINKWDSELITTISSTLGNYSFKVEFKDSEGLFSKPVYANRSVWVRNNLPVISDELDDIKVGSTQMILKLSDYGYDVETSKSNLRWLFDFSTVDTTLFHIDDENLDEQELIIYPAKSKEGRDDITLILIDMDNGKAVKTDVTIVINSKTGGKDQLPDQDNPIESMVGTSNIWLYILIIVLIIIFIILLIFYRRKKQKERAQKEEAEKETEGASVSESVLKIPVADDEATPTIEGTAPEPVPTIEAPKESVPVPMPAEAPRPQLPEATVQPTEPVVKPLVEPEENQTLTPGAETSQQTPSPLPILEKEQNGSDKDPPEAVLKLPDEEVEGQSMKTTSRPQNEKARSEEDI